MTRIFLSIVIVFLALFGLFILSGDPDAGSPVADANSARPQPQTVELKPEAQESSEEIPPEIVAQEIEATELSEELEEKEEPEVQVAAVAEPTEAPAEEPAAEAEVAVEEEKSVVEVAVAEPEPTEAPAAQQQAVAIEEGQEDLPVYKRAGVSSVNGSKAVILFASDSTELTESAQVALSKIAMQLSGNAALGVYVTGNTDSIGNPEANEWFSKSRARAVAKELRSLGVPEQRITTSSLVGAKPAGGGRPNWRVRQQNRRVEVVLK